MAIPAGYNPGFEAEADRSPPPKPTDNILFPFQNSDIEMFRSDFGAVVTTCNNIDHEFADQGQPGTESDIAKFRILLEQFNRKYSLRLEIQDTDLQVRLRIMFNDSMDGVIDIIRKMHDVTEIKRFHDHILAEFKEGNNLSVKDAGKPVLVYPKSDLLDINSPEYRICVFYALSGIDRTLDLSPYINSFSFMLGETESKTVKEGDYELSGDSPSH